VEDGRLLRIDPDPTHPTGAALCGKGRASVDLVEAPQRLLHPLRRTRPKGADDPGWERIGWDDALDLIAGRLRAIAAQSGPEAVTFGSSTPSGTALADAFPWIDRLTYVFGSPNFLAASTEICNWHRDDAYALTFGAAQPPPDLERTGCLVLWGHNPRATWLARMTRALSAGRRGTGLLVVDPRREGLAARADVWLRVRPGADAAVALALAGELLRHGWYDEDFVGRWTTAPALVREDDGRLLRGRDVALGEDDALVGAGASGELRPVRPGEGSLALLADRPVLLADGRRVRCRSAFALLRERALAWTPERAAEVAWVDADGLRAAARLLHERRPVAHATWTGVGQGTNATQTARALATLYALTGDWDAPGGNVQFAGVPTDGPWAFDELDREQQEKALGRAERPLGPPARGQVATGALWRSVLEGTPYRTRALVAFGINPVMTHADPLRARRALEALELHVQVDQVMTPTARFADVVLPASTHWEREAVHAGFAVDAEGMRTVQWRPAVVAARGEARGDLEIVCALAERLGLAQRLGGRTPRELHERLLAPSGVTVEQLQRAPGHRLAVAVKTRLRKYAETGPDGLPTGFATPSGRVELYHEGLLGQGQDPLAAHEEPAVSPWTLPPASRRRFPLVLTSAKLPQFCHSQHRGLARLRRAVREPQVALHPDAAAARRLEEGAWVRIVSPRGQVRARLQFDRSLDPRVACGQFGWWEACPELGLPGYPPLATDGTSANFGLLVGGDELDPVSGSQPLRQYVCEVQALEPQPSR